MKSFCVSNQLTHYTIIEIIILSLAKVPQCEIHSSTVHIVYEALRPGLWVCVHATDLFLARWPVCMHSLTLWLCPCAAVMRACMHARVLACVRPTALVPH